MAVFQNPGSSGMVLLDPPFQALCSQAIRNLGGGTMVKKIFALAVVALGLSAQASTIGNGPPNQSGGSDLNSFLEADNFNTGGGNLITHVKFWALAGSLADYTGSIDWGFYSDASGSPGAVVVSGNAAAIETATGNTTLGLNEYGLEFDVNALLAANTTYWLVLHNGPSGTDPMTSFYWAWSSGAAGNSQNSDITAPSWVGNDAELAFQVTTTAVPEPASLSLIAGGVITGWLKRRKLLATN
jgi:ethanolamine utilization microcompartment shell protein EutS